MARWALVGVTIAACGGATAPTTSPTSVTTTTVTAPAAAPRMVVEPEFIQGVIPGADTVLLVRLAEDERGPVELAVDASLARVSVNPGTIAGSEVAEVVIVPEATEVERELSVEIAATREGATSRVSRSMTVVPWPDDREEQAREILGLFLPWLAEQRSDLGITSSTELSGSFTAPMLLVVSHYTFFSEDWEIGLSWHVMVPPDDFAEIYLRPRGEMKPTMAFRVASWQTALETGQADIVEVGPPAGVIR